MWEKLRFYKNEKFCSHRLLLHKDTQWFSACQMFKMMNMSIILCWEVLLFSHKRTKKTLFRFIFMFFHKLLILFQLFLPQKCMFLFYLLPTSKKSKCLCMVKPLPLPLTVTWMLMEAVSASRNLIRTRPFHRSQPGTALHVNNVCLLLSKEGAGWGLSDAKTNWAPIPKHKNSWPVTLHAVVSFLCGLVLIWWDEMEEKSIVHWAQICKYCTEFSCFIFLNVMRLCCSTMLVFGKAPVFNILQQSVLLFWSTWTKKNGTVIKAPLYPFFFTWFFFQLKSLCFCVL